MGRRGMIQSAKKPRKKKCKNTDCRAEFVPARPLQSACSMACALVVGKASQDREKKARDRAERAETRKAKERIKSRRDYLREAQQAVNAWIRLRDAEDGCISCDKPATWQGQWHASHLKSVGSSPALRFEPLNIHKACSICNNHLSGNIGSYLPALIRKIGAEKVEWLNGPHEPKRYTIEELKEIKAKYRALARELKRGMQ